MLIDVTLVEITRTDSFEYDLNLVAAANNAVTGNLVIDPIQTADSGSRLEAGFNLLDQDGNPTGRTRAFYSDEHVQALLTAMQRKNYGRVLAKPKVLVDDGRKGQIVTTDTTTYVKESIQIPQTGTPITTREFVPIEASIELEITPHISEGNLLRLEVLHVARRLRQPAAIGRSAGQGHQRGDHDGVRAGRPHGDPGRAGETEPEQRWLQGAFPRRYPGGRACCFEASTTATSRRSCTYFSRPTSSGPTTIRACWTCRRSPRSTGTPSSSRNRNSRSIESIPGITPEPMPPEGVLRDYK